MREALHRLRIEAADQSDGQFDARMEVGEVDDRVKGLRAGGDDYLVKPFAFAELLARQLKNPLIFDGRNIYDPAFVRSQGIQYLGIGRKG